jgi:hypothetical protein
MQQDENNMSVLCILFLQHQNDGGFECERIKEEESRKTLYVSFHSIQSTHKKNDMWRVRDLCPFLEL